MSECSEWIFECRRIFPSIDNLSITGEYKKMRKGLLGYVKGTVAQEENIDPEALLLEGITRRRGKKRLAGNFTIFINEKFKNVNSIKLRKQVVQNIMIHELLHVEHKDLLTLSKNYKRRKKKKIHVKDFEQECFGRFNKLRKLTRVPKIESKKDLDSAISSIVRKMKI